MIYMRGNKMKAELKEKIENHALKLMAIFPDIKETNKLDLCKGLFRLENEAERLALDYCNGDLEEERYEKESNKVLEKVGALLGLGTWGELNQYNLFVNGDPRGYALKIDSDYVKAHDLDIPKDWGGYGLIAPDLRLD